MAIVVETRSEWRRRGRSGGGGELLREVEEAAFARSIRESKEEAKNTEWEKRQRGKEASAGRTTARPPDATSLQRQRVPSAGREVAGLVRFIGLIGSAASQDGAALSGTSSISVSPAPASCIVLSRRLCVLSVSSRSKRNNDAHTLSFAPSLATGQ